MALDKLLLSNADEDQSGTVSLNDTLTFQFVATNIGNVTLTNVTIVDPLPGLSALTCNPAQPTVLAPNASLTCTATYAVKQADVIAGKIFNETTVDSSETEEVKDNMTAPVPQQPLLAALGNRVWYDSNGNGQQDEGEENAAGVKVTLFACEDAEQAPAAQVGVPALTDVNGTYLYSNLQPGCYYMIFSDLPEGFAFTSPNANGVSDVLDSDAGLDGKTPTVTLQAGETNLDLDAGLVEVEPPTDPTNLPISEQLQQQQQRIYMPALRVEP